MSDTYVTRTFTVDELDDLEVADHGSAVVEDVAEEKRRWYTRHRVVFRHDDQLWQVRYDEPATEMQEGLDTWGGQDPVTAHLVEPYEVVVTRYRSVAHPAPTP